MAENVKEKEKTMSEKKNARAAGAEAAEPEKKSFKIPQDALTAILAKAGFSPRDEIQTLEEIADGYSEQKTLAGRLRREVSELTKLVYDEDTHVAYKEICAKLGREVREEQWINDKLKKQSAELVGSLSTAERERDAAKRATATVAAIFFWCSVPANGYIIYLALRHFFG